MDALNDPEKRILRERDINLAQAPCVPRHGSCKGSPERGLAQLLCGRQRASKEYQNLRRAQVNRKVRASNTLRS